MPDKPLLILPHSAPLPREKRSIPIKSHLRLPGRGDQGRQIGPQLTTMLDAFVADTPAGTSTENILVLETIGRPDNFRTAVNAVPGLKWLAEIDQDDLEADARFFERPKIGAYFFKHLVGTKDSRVIVTALTASGVLYTDGILQDVSEDAIRAAIPHVYKEHADKIVAAIDVLNRMECASTSIDVSGFTLNSMLKQAQRLKRLLVNDKIELRLLAMDPNGNAIEQICKRYKKEICRYYLKNSCTENGVNLCSGEVSHRDCEVNDKQLKNGMSELIRDRLNKLIEELFLVDVTEDLLRALEESGLDKNKVSILRALMQMQPPYYDTNKFKEIIGEEEWIKNINTFIDNRVAFDIKVIDQRLPTGYFIVDREKDFGLMHAEIELDDKNIYYRDQNFTNPLFILHKQFDDDCFETFANNFDALWDKATFYLPESKFSKYKSSR